MIKAQGNVFQRADSLFQAKNYTLARVEYERIIFENNSPGIRAEAGIKKADCLKMTGDYAEAASALNAVNISTLPDAVRYQILFQSALDAYLAHDPDDAFSGLERISHFYPDSAQKQDLLFLKILSLNELRRWKEADTVYQEFMTRFNHEASLSNPYLNIPKLKDPLKAEKLSAYLPFTGAGLFYAGDVKEGILNVVLQLGFISFGAYSMLMERYITGALIGVGGYAAFYKGGERRAKRFAEKNNEKKVIVFNTKVRNQLLLIIKNRIQE